jgi:hypothetical protein
MIKEWRTHLMDRLRNPLLGPFTALWLAWNWRLVSVLLFSPKDIETRIQYIDANYINIMDVFVYPMGGAITFALVVPWLSLLFQSIQRSPNIRREKGALLDDTELLNASVAKAEAQATLNRILAQDEITKRQQEELDSLKSELDKQKEVAESRVAVAQAEFDEKLKEYESRSDKNNHEDLSKKEELEYLRRRMEEEQARARAEVEVMREELNKKQKDIERKLKSPFQPTSKSTISEIEELLTSGMWKLFHNPSIGPERSKDISFKKSGEIQAGRNNNENKWRLTGGALEILQADGNVHSRFYFIPESKIFLHTGDVDTRSARGQYIIPLFNLRKS